MPKNLSSIFRYPGGKSKASIRDWILTQLPAGTQEYREPCVGGGGVLFSVPTNLRRWINDKHIGLIAVYQALKRGGTFIEQCRSVKPPLETFFNRCKTDVTMDAALRYYFINRTVFGGRVNYDIPSRIYFSNPSGWNIIKTNKLEQAAQLLKGVRITSVDYTKLLEEPGRGVWIYLDPPYVVNTRLTASSQLYQHSFSMDDHVKLSKDVHACQHKVCLSYDDDPLIRKLYRDFRILKQSHTNCGTTNNVKRKVTELLICNY